MENITFSEQVKKEICNSSYSDDCTLYLTYSFIINKFKMNLSSDKTSLDLESSFSFIIRYIGENIKKFFNITPVYSYSEINNLTKSRTYRLSIEDSKTYQKIIKIFNSWSTPTFYKSLNKDKKQGLMIGAFLSNGSVNSLEKSIYHLEFRSQNVNYLRVIQKVMVEYHFSPSLLKRKYWYCLYIKKANKISDYLKTIGANNSMHQLEEKIIERDFSNQLQRLNNLDLSNMNRAVHSGEQEAQMIQQIVKTEAYKNSSKKFQNFCQLRLKNPSLTLSELVPLYQKAYHIKITKSGLNHYVIKLRIIYKNQK